MGRLLTLGILGTASRKKIAVRTVRTVRRVPMGIVPCALLLATLAEAQTGSNIAGTITTSAKGAAPIRVTIDQKVCGDQLPDEAIVVDG
jgi:hypothetical protein